jgi:hypothetical protein
VSRNSNRTACGFRKGKATMIRAQGSVHWTVVLGLTASAAAACGGRSRTEIVIDERNGGSSAIGGSSAAVSPGSGGRSGSRSGTAGQEHGASQGSEPGGIPARDGGADAGGARATGGSAPAAEAGEAGARAEGGRADSAGGKSGGAGTDTQGGRADSAGGKSGGAGTDTAGSKGGDLAGAAGASAGAGATGDSLACSGEGLIYVVPDECINDGGFSAGGDSLELYCCADTVRFCLSGEACPWREGCVDQDTTCSRAGLESDYLANAWCSEWQGHFDYFCSPEGRIYFDGEPGARSRLPFVSDASWTVYEMNPIEDASARPLGPAQPVCLNALSPTTCPSGAVSWDYTGTEWETDLSSIPGAAWIWAPVLSATSPADLQRFVFVRQFQLGVRPTGTLAIAADNYAEIYLNDTFFGSVGSISEQSAPTPMSPLTRFDFNDSVQEGSNVITIVAQNGPAWFAGSSTSCNYSCNPAGVVFGGEFTFE